MQDINNRMLLGIIIIPFMKHSSVFLGKSRMSQSQTSRRHFLFSDIVIRWLTDYL
jgi:hypothetical protein